MAIGISGLAAGRLQLVAASAIMLAVGSWRVKTRRSDYVLLGAVKLMMPTLIRHPMMMLPIVCTAGVICWRVVQY